MSDPGGEMVRLVEAGDSDGASILRAWSRKQPSEAARTATLAAVGIGGLIVGASGTAAAGASASIAPKAALVTSAALKWLLGAFVATLALGGGAYWMAARAPVGVEAPTSVTASPVAPPLPAVAPPAPSAWTVVPPLAAAPTQADRSSTRPPSSPATHDNVASASASSLDEEVQAIDDARRTLASGDAPRALTLLDAHDAKHPNGALSEESAEVRVEALYRAGRAAEGHALAVRFLAAHPKSPYARVIRSLETNAGAPPP